MEVLKYLNNLTKSGASCYTALGILQENYGIKFSENKEYELFVLNYDQIDSHKHKFDQIVRECRSLVLGVYGNQTKHGDWWEEFYVVSRSFDRFYNLDENPDDNYDLRCLDAVEKVDGSLVSLFFHDGSWLYRTKSMIMPTSSINGFETTWKELIEEALNFPYCTQKLDTSSTYIFEVTSPENRVVVRYPTRKATLLAVRDKNFGFYVTPSYVSPLWRTPEYFGRKPKQEMIEFVNSLPNMEEGVVLYNNKGIPVLKVKSKKYLVAHTLRGEGLNPKRCMDLVMLGETDEYLSIFPEDKNKILPYIYAHTTLLTSVVWCWDKYRNITAQKDFALAIKDLPHSSILFSMRNGLTFKEAWDKLTQKAKYKMIEAFLNKQEK